MKYDQEYNLTEELRVLFDSDYKKDIETFEKAKNHILLIIQKEEIDTKEYTDRRKQNLDTFFKRVEEHMKGEKTIDLVSVLGGEINAFIAADAGITSEYMGDVLKLLLEYVNRNK